MLQKDSLHKKLLYYFDKIGNLEKEISEYTYQNGTPYFSSTYQYNQDNFQIKSETKNLKTGELDSKFGQRRKIGFYLGQIKGDILEYKWQWYERELIGYGQMIIAKGKMSGIWWYENFKKETEHVEYEYLDDQMPKWLDYTDYKELWYKKMNQ